MTHGVYRVTGKRRYRGHEPGSVFEAILDRGPEQRAIARGDIELLNRVTPALVEGSFTFPEGWLPDSAAPKTTGGADRRLFLLKEG